MRPHRAVARALSLALVLSTSHAAYAQDADPETGEAPAARSTPRPRPVRKPPPRPVPAKPAAQAKPAAPDPAPPTAAEMQPAIHARNAGATSCAQSVLDASEATIGSTHKARSTWVTTDPNGHVFQSIVGIDQHNKTSPNSAVVISSTPTPARGCDTTTLQVLPTGRTCEALRKELLKDGSFVDELEGMPLIRSPSGFQHLLMPGYGGGCVIVAVGIGLTPPPAQASAPRPAPQAGPQAVPAPAAQPAPVPVANVPPRR